MKTILYMATSLTGKTTASNDDTSWVEASDIERMDALMIECGAMIMGKSTYESFGDDLPIGKALLVIMTHDKELLQRSNEELMFTDKSPSEILQLLDKGGFKQVMLAGGENLNSVFLKEGLINEIRVIVKPFIIGQGKSLFNVEDFEKQVKLTDVTKLPGDSIELTYEV